VCVWASLGARARPKCVPSRTTSGNAGQFLDIEPVRPDTVFALGTRSYHSVVRLPGITGATIDQDLAAARLISVAIMFKGMCALIAEPDGPHATQRIHRCGNAERHIAQLRPDWPCPPAWKVRPTAKDVIIRFFASSGAIRPVFGTEFRSKGLRWPNGPALSDRSRIALPAYSPGPVTGCFRHRPDVADLREDQILGGHARPLRTLHAAFVFGRLWIDRFVLPQQYVLVPRPDADHSRHPIRQRGRYGLVSSKR